MHAVIGLLTEWVGLGWTAGLVAEVDFRPRRAGYTGGGGSLAGHCMQLRTCEP